MTSFFHLAALCCLPPENEKARQRERQIFREALLERAKYVHMNDHSNGFSNGNTNGNGNSNGHHDPLTNGRLKPRLEA